MSDGLALLLVLLFSWPSLWAPGPAANSKGNRSYRQGNYDRALADYRKAQELLPGERILNYNSGTALLGGNKPDEAVQSLMSAAGDPRREVQSRALYNAGNALAGAGKLEEALGTYRQAVLADPKNLDAKFNYELTKRRLEQKQKEDQQQKKDDTNKDGDKDQEKKQDQGQDPKQDQKQDQEKNQQQQDQQKTDQDSRPEEPTPQDEQQPPPADSSGTAQPAALLTRQEAERLLDALKDNEVKQLKDRLKSPRKKNVDKDW